MSAINALSAELRMDVPGGGGTKEMVAHKTKQKKVAVAREKRGGTISNGWHEKNGLYQKRVAQKKDNLSFFKKSGTK